MPAGSNRTWGFGAHALSVLALTFACRASASPPPPLPPDSLAKAVKLEVFARGLSEPLGLVFAPGDKEQRVFVVEKPGRVRIFREGRLTPTPFVDISERVSGGAEQGLLGVAFHPRFAENKKLYANFTDKNGNTNVVEWKVAQDDPNRVDLAQEKRIFYVEQPYSNHNGGDVVFGPDGKLYVGLGDGGSRFDPHGNGQNKATPLGKMTRIDVDAATPKPEMVALGLRNPWRYSFDRKNGDLYIADVGQNEWEEVDVVTGGKLVGQNFGWSVRESMHCTQGDNCPRAGFVDPVVEYGHADGCSITGGHVYRGAALPEIQGHYFYADYCTAIIRSFRWENGHVADPYSWRPILDPDSKLAKLTSFGEDEQGELYLLSQEGIVYKFARR
jgi:glucose/arabinose dehydrogenase